jgi:hypothetical protein
VGIATPAETSSGRAKFCESLIWFFKNYKRNLDRLAANDFSVTAGRAVLSKQGGALIENLHYEGDSLIG